MELTSGTTAILAVAAVVVALVAVVVAVRALRGQQRTVDTYRRFSRGSEEDVLTLLDRYINEVTALRADVERLRDYADTLRELIAAGFSRIGVVRYDAFDDMGGRMSYSAALTDEHGDGVVLTAINGRVETRSYAKSLRGWTSEHNLSREEREAVVQAQSRGGGGATAAPSAEVRRRQRPTDPAGARPADEVVAGGLTRP